jgi:uncharacterized protein YutE (UPF0331/DUF86 family)
MRKMVGFRNLAVHDYGPLQLPIVTAVISRHLEEFLSYSRALPQKDGRGGVQIGP